MKAINNHTKDELRGFPSRWNILSAAVLFGLALVFGLNTAVLAQNNESGDFDYGKVDLRVGVWLDRAEDEIYQRGEEMGAGFQTNEDAYAVVYRIDADGLVTVLWPRSRLDDGFVFGGHEYLLPVAGARQLRTSNNEGEGFVEAVVSKYPFDLRDLEIDFHHEQNVDKFHFQVAGDPFLAMNEVNFAVTGLENSEEYVVTNYTSYYVHRQVEHPRYLCNQCHFEDEVAYQPYRDTCTLEIKYDYGWVNSWYTDYGYYPVYANPVYVYVDPWTWRPWINFWYWPSYTCAPYYGYGWYGRTCYSWGYSPYYAGNCYTYYDNGSHGNRRYKPLTQGGRGGAVTKTREYASVSRMVNSDTPDSRQRDAMSNRTRMSDLDGLRGRSGNLAATGARRSGGADTKVSPRGRPRFDEGVRTRGNAGLRIRDGGSTTSRSRTNSGVNGRTGGRQTEPDFRHRAGGGGIRSGLVPVSRGSGSSTTVRGSGTSRTGGSVQDRKAGNQTGQRSTQRTIKPVEPRKRGTRVWNSGRSGQSSDRNDRTRQVRPGSNRPSRSTQGTRSGSSSRVKPDSRSKKSSGTKERGSKVKPKSGSSRSKGNTTRSSGSVGNKSNSNSGGSRSSGSSSGGSRSSGGRSGGSRSSGGGSSKGGSRGGGTSHRR
ncbi:MAG: DUF4384 domain-containing protein [Candidatus Krumholzibacteriota bacterium]